jgi:hypothetical protein
MENSRYREPELSESVNLCLADGRLNPDAVGWSRRPIHNCNLSRGWLSKKRWNFWAVTTHTDLFMLSISNRDYLGRSFVEYGSFEEGYMVGTTVFVPFGRGLVMPDTVHESASFKHPGLRIGLDQASGGVRILVEARNVGGKTLSADFAIKYPEGHETLSVVIPWSERRYQFTSKHNCLPATGLVRLGSKEISFEGPQCFACHDYGRGIWPRRSIWNWGAASGRRDGRTIGLNFGGKWTDNTGMTENGICIDGRLSKVSEDLFWEYDRTNWMKPWRIEARETHQVDLGFTPILEKSAAHRMGPLHSEVHQMFGFYDGTVVTDDDERIEISELLGWAEEFTTLW